MLITFVKVIQNYCGLIGCKRKKQTLMALEDVLDKYREHLSVDEKTTGKIEPYYSDDYVTVYTPQTVEQSMYYGRGTRWCTAAKNDNVFYMYKNLFILIPRVANYKGEKYQIPSWEQTIDNITSTIIERTWKI
jgi:hypothetical protein